MSLGAKLRDAWACETCRRYRQGAAVVIALLAVTWMLG